VTAFENDSSLYLSLRLTKPDSSSWFCDFNYSNCQIDDVLLEASGTYTLTVDGRDNTVGPYSLALNRLNGDEQAIAYGQTVNDNITPYGDQDSFTFEGQAGDRVTAFENDSALYLSLRLTKPDGSSWFCDFNYYNCQIDDVLLEATGTYTLTVDGRDNTTGPYTLALNRLNRDEQAITYGQTVNDNITPFGDQDSFTFEGQAGDRITAFENDSALYLSLRLMKPDGSSWFCDFNYYNCQIEDVPLTENGTYTITVDGRDNTTGPYTLALNQLNRDEQTITYGQTINDNITPYGDQDSFTFHGRAGDRVTAFENDSALYLSLRLTGPDGSSWFCDFNYYNCQIDDALLPEDGTYTITVDGRDNTTGPYTLALNRLNGDEQAITYGQAINDNLTPYGDQDSFTFQGQAGDRVTAFETDSALYLSLRLTKPDGSSWSCDFNYYNCQVDDVLLPEDGTYTLTVDGRDNATGPYTLYLHWHNDPATTIPIFNGQTKNGNITLPGERDGYTFTALAGDVFSVNARRTSGYLDPELRVYAPDGSRVASAWGYPQATITDTIAPVSGSYVLLLGDDGGEESGAYTVTLRLASAVPIELGQPYTTVIHPQELQVYSLQLETAGQSLLVEVAPLDGSPALWVSSRFASPPAGGRYDLRTTAPTTRGVYELAIAPTQVGIYYFSVFGAQVAGQGSYRITARLADRHLSDVQPRSGGNRGGVTVLIQGLGLVEGMGVELRRAGQPSRPADQVTWVSSTSLWAHFDLQGAVPGNWDVALAWPGGEELAMQGVFAVTAGVGPRLEARLDAPEIVRGERENVLWVEYTNTGDADMPAPLFVVSAPEHVIMRLSTADPYTAEPVQVLGVSFDRAAGVLSPGATYRIPVYFKSDAPGHARIQLNLEQMVVDSTPIDWDAIAAEVRPPGLSDELWTALWGNFTARMGGTWADYLTALDGQATSLAQHGSLTYDVRLLVSALMSQSAAAQLPQTLAASVDAYAPARGLPLVFARAAYTGLDGRFTLGPLGRGWSHSYDYALTRPDANTVVIQGPGGTERLFRLDWDGNWQPSAGDYARLEAAQGGGFTLLEPDGLRWSFDANGRLAAVEEPNGNRLALAYNAAGRLASLSHSNGQTFSLAYNAQGRLSTLTDHAGQVTQYAYDAGGERLLRVTAPGGVVTQYAYLPANAGDAAHALQTVTYPDGTHQYYSYDDQGRLSAQWRDGETERLEYAYDEFDSVFVKDAEDQETALRLGARGQPLAIQDPLGRRAGFTYDSSYNLTRLVQPGGQASTLDYDTLGNPSQSVDALGSTTTLAYTTDLSRLDWLRDARGNLTDFAYDDSGNLAGITYPGGSSEVFAYDTQGNLTGFTNRRGQTIQFTYNALGQLTRKTYPVGRTIDYAYDTRGFLTSAADSAAGTISMQYDAHGFLTRIDYPGGRWFTFEYNHAGQRTRRTSHDGYVLNYVYDSAGRLIRLSDGTGTELIRYEYDSIGRLSREVKGNGTTAQYTYDAAGQLTSLVNAEPGGGLVQSRFDYTYDANGNRTFMTTLEGTNHYTYDALGQLTGWDAPGGRQVRYAYDAVGNRVTVSDNGVVTPYTTNNLNQYTRVGADTYTYDADGNMASKTDSTGTTTYTYDPENRLAGVSAPGGETWAYTYDALGNRVTVEHNGVATHYLHDPIGLVDVAAEYGDDGTLAARYVHGFGLVARVAASGSAAYYAFDGTGHTRQITGTSGEVVNTYDYDPFGIFQQTNGVIPNPFRYVGKYGVIEDNNDLVYMRMRFYNPTIGRFFTNDLVFSTNRLSYARNSPINLIDPLGFWYIDINYTVNIGPLAGAGVGIVTGPAVTIGLQIAPGKSGGISIYPYIGGGIAVNPGVGLGGGGGGSFSITWSPNNASAGVFNTGQVCSGLCFSSGFAADWPIRDVFEEWGLGSPGLFNGQIFVSGDIVEGIRLFINWLRLFISRLIEVLQTLDPNEKLGPPGVGALHGVSSTEELQYTIYFENVITATAPAQEVFITDALDTDLDWTSFTPTEIAFGSRTVSISQGPGGYSARLTIPDWRPGVHKTWWLDVTASIDYKTGAVRWTLRMLDPLTGELPTDPLAGFLPPNDPATGRGEGHVSFRIRLRPGLPLGARIDNQAVIVFDLNDPIATNAVWNTVGVPLYLPILRR
jgi:RHS repeat-associated protein